jgi:hypothetical protein
MHFMSDSVQKALEGLEAWRGGYAVVWDYSISHSILRIRIARKDSDCGAILVLHDCNRLIYDPAWQNVDIRVAEYVGDHARRRYRVTDSERLDVDCGMLYFSEESES